MKRLIINIILLLCSCALFCQDVWDRAHDLNKISADQAAFLAQKDTPGGKRTMNAYLWKLEGEAYDANH